ncbi:MAG: hypothetical protein PHT62_11140 [Desulfotomaculaceae bacterium]|nr:hypothetical protein [Desulfotomaculaceae bacterium]
MCRFAAIEVLAVNLTLNIKNIYWNSSPGIPHPEYNFTFTCMHQGILVSDRGYSVTVDGPTGGITAFYDRNSSSSVTLPDSKNVVTTEAAKAEFLKSHPLRLVYLWPEYFGQKAPKPFLVYMPDYGASMEYIDAFTVL